MLPRHLTLVRHGYGEHDEAAERSWQGDHSLYTEEFQRRFRGDHRLTRRGVKQMKRAGEVLRRNGDDRFDVYYVSPFIRTLESAGHLGLPDAQWEIHRHLIERDTGLLEGRPVNEVIVEHQEQIDKYDRNPIYYRPPQGESMIDVTVRLRTFFDEESIEEDDRVIIVTHARVMWALRMIFEHLHDDEFEGRGSGRGDAKHPLHIYNAHILQYERRVSQPRFSHVRSIVPGQPELSRGWQRIRHRTYTNVELLHWAERVPRLFED